MKNTVNIILGAGLGATLPILAQDPGAAAIAEAGAKFQKNCMGCHQPPDRRFATDRAWIGQIRETA